MVGKAHPNIFEVFEAMKEQASSEMKLEQLELERRFVKWISTLFE